MTSFLLGIMRHPPVDVALGTCYGHRDIALKPGWEIFVNTVPQDISFQKIYASPVSRCLKLAEAIAIQRNIPCHIDHRLIEFNFGDWEGKLWDDIPRELIDAWAKDPWNWHVPGGESGQELLTRVTAVWNEIKDRKENAIIISHGGPLRLIRALAQEKAVELLGELPDFGSFELFHFSK